MPFPPSILVLGAGELGTKVLHALDLHPQSERGTITVLLRPSTFAIAEENKRVNVWGGFHSYGVATLAGDLATSTQEELTALFRPFHTIIGCTGMSCPPGTQLKIARAVLAARVKRYLPWQFGVDYDIIGPSSSQDLFTEQLDVRAILRAQEETKWVIVSTGMFMSFLFEPSFGVVSEDRKTVRALGSWENKVTVTGLNDIGHVVASIINMGKDAQGVVYTAGETISYRDLANVVEKVWRHKVTREELTVEMLKEELAKDPENGLKKYRVVFGEGKGVSWDEKETLHAEYGMKLENVEQWMMRNHQ